MMAVCLAFLALSILLYALLGGADYGAGILELVKGDRLVAEQEKLIDKAMGPVWEANHIWLVLAVVILLMGFPEVYALLLSRLSIPVTFALAGIVLRGTAFAFRHYDVPHPASRRVYTAVFGAASLVAPFWLGVIAAAPMTGKLAAEAGGFEALYVAPWANPFCFAVGLFACALFAMIAAVYLLGETRDSKLQALLARRARAANLAALALGGLVFYTAGREAPLFLAHFRGNPESQAAVVFATASIYVLWRAMAVKRYGMCRFVVGFQVAQILGGWYAAAFPYLVLGGHGAWTYTAVAAPEPVLRQLVLALVFGLVLVIPALGFLLRVFKAR